MSQNQIGQLEIDVKTHLAVTNNKTCVVRIQKRRLTPANKVVKQPADQIAASQEPQSSYIDPLNNILPSSNLGDPI